MENGVSSGPVHESMMPVSGRIGESTDAGTFTPAGQSQSTPFASRATRFEPYA